jgi:hypothetical protein
VAARIDSTLLERLATDSGLFHRDGEGRSLARALTLEPLRALADLLEPGMSTLETGCGGTTVAFAAAGAHHTVVTPDGDEAERVRAFCEEHDIDTGTLEFLIGSSDEVLVGWHEPLDVLLIDGAHRVPFPFLDWHYGARTLKVGGLLLLDDIPIPAVHLLYDFLRGEPEWRLVRIYGDKLALFEKLAEPADQPGQDWELQRYNQPWRYAHVPLRRRWRRLRDWAMLGTRLRRLRSRSR